MDKRIGFQEINDVHSSVRRSKDKWEKIGTRLGLSESALTKIKSDEGNISDRCLYAVLNVWLHGKTDKAISWRVLLDILKCPEVNESSLADRIANKKGFSSFDGSSVKSIPQEKPVKSLLKNDTTSDSSVVLHLDHLPFLLKNLKDIASKWKQFGTYLYVPIGDLDNIEANAILIPNSPLSYLQELLAHWLRQASSMPNAEKLFSALKACGEFQLSSALRESIICGNHEKELSDLAIVTQPMFLLESYVRSRYQLSNENHQYEWPPTLEVEYINLILLKHEKILPYSSQKILADRQGDLDSILKHSDFQSKLLYLEDIASYDSFGKAILIVGCPGIGKTTLACKLRHEWAVKKMLNDFWLLLYIPLRSPLMRTAQSFDDVLQLFGNNYSYHDIHRIKASLGKGIILVLDGWDELRPSCRGKDMFFPKLIEKEILPECTIIVTSRPGAAEDIRNCTSRHVEILGFTEEQIHTYILSYFKENEPAGRKLIEDLMAFPNVASACYVAVNLTIVCYVYLVCDYCLPETLTEVYELFIINTIKRHFKRFYDSEVNVETVSECDKFVKGMIKSLAKLALKSLENNDLSFTNQELLETCSIDESQISFDGFGLLRTIKIFHKMRTEFSYYFLHLTIHEFLAAYSVFVMSENDKWSWLGRHLSNERFEMVMKFFCGMDKFQSRSPRILFSNETQKIFSVPFTLECIFEGQWEDGCKKVAMQTDYNMSISRPIQPYRALVYGYIISNSKASWQLHLNYNLGEHEMKCLTRYLLNAPHALRIFNVSKIKVSVKVAESICKILKSQKQLTYFSVVDSLFDKTSLEIICSGIYSHETLETIQLINTRINNSSLEIICSLITNLTSLKQIDIRGNDFDDEAQSKITQTANVSVNVVF